ncbi:hypothetical protein [uncultured Nocardioides sp.]|uniref:hypothetical protein n=1 Tax=uncultured Nocardioides sp. TaxID=198441 RepID=UPI002624AF4A|nr:hypothetical protein [uncultured Nocardioides sp.]
MADDYVIVARIVLKDESGPGVAGAKKGLAEVERQAVTVGNNMGRQLMQAFAGFGSMASVAAASRSIVKINSEMETATASMASLFTATFGMDMVAGLEQARSVMADLNADAASGVGEMMNYAEAYQLLLSPVTSAGGDLDLVRRLTAQSLTAGFALRGQQGLALAPMDITQALQQGANQRITPIASAALRAADISEEAFNAMTVANKIEALTEAFGRFDAAIEIMGGTWDAQMATLQDGFKQLLRTATTPLFDRWSDQLSKANGWMEANNDLLAKQVDVWGARLLSVWDHLIDKAGTYAAIVGGVTVVQGLGGGGNLADMAGRGAGMVRTGAGALRSVAADPFGMGAMINGSLGLAGGSSGVGGMLSQLGVGLRGLAVGASRLAWPIAAITGGFLAVQGAMVEFPAALGFMTDAWGTVMVSFGQLGDVFGELNAEGSALSVVGAGLLYALGGLGYAVSFIIKGFTTLTKILGLAIQNIGLGLHGLWALANGDTAGAKGIFNDAAKNAYVDMPSELFDMWTNWGPATREVDRLGFSDVPPVDRLGYSDVPDTPKDTPKLPPLNIGPVKIEITAETMEDPARVAVTMETVLGRLSRHRTQARRPGLPYAF